MKFFLRQANRQDAKIAEASRRKPRISRMALIKDQGFICASIPYDNARASIGNYLAFLASWRILSVMGFIGLGFGGANLFAQAPATPPAAPAPAAPATTPPAPPKPIRQVRAEMRILDWQLNNATDFDFAVFYTGNGNSKLKSADLTLPSPIPLSSAARLFLTGLDAGNGSFDAVIETLQTAGKVKVLSQPSVILSVSDKPKDPAKPAAYDAQVTSGTRVPYESAKALGVTIATTTEYRDTGVKLECNARDIKFDEFIQLEINASVTDLTGFINIAKTAAGDPLRVPVLDTRVLQNQVLVRDRSIFISGLLKASREIERHQGIPWISELPLLRNALANTHKETQISELVFLIKPEILAPVEVKQ